MLQFTIFVDKKNDILKVLFHYGFLFSLLFQIAPLHFMRNFGNSQVIKC